MASGFGVLTPKGRCYPFWLVSPSPLSALWPAFCSFPLTRSRAGLHEVHAGRRHEAAVAVQAAGRGLRRLFALIRRFAQAHPRDPLLKKS